jgi:alkanesulfonate monooxygenase SsuD/methylene tetrahydromethanopterin reductase-like flavin-dependent oxidoreductase (luciferase family)
MFYEIPSADTSDKAVEVRFHQALEQIELADRAGFAHAWFVEHHFLPGYSYLSSPEIFVGAASQRTKNIRLGHAIMHLPFNINSPLRVAERIATEDILSHGRIDFGGGRATTAEELLGFGVDPEVTKAQQEEALRMVSKMWTQETFSWDSDLIKVPPRVVIPKPVQKPHPPMWMACTGPETLLTAARLGVGALGLGGFAASRAEGVKAYRDGIAACTNPAGAFINNQIGLLASGLCCPSDEEAREIQEPNIKLFHAQVASYFAPWAHHAPPSYAYIEQRAKQSSERSASPIEDPGSPMGSPVGSPETVLRYLTGAAEDGIDEVFFYMQMSSTTHEQVIRSIELIADKVMPKLPK